MIYLKALGGLIICLGMVFLFASLAKRYRDRLERLFSGKLFVPPAPRRLRTLERLQLAPGHVAIILEKDGDEHFVLLSPQSAHTIKPGQAPKKAKRQ